MAFILLIILLFMSVVTAMFLTDSQKIAPIVLGIVLAAASLFQLISIVPAGHIGIVDTFGSVSERSLKPGLNMVNPFAIVPKMSIQTQELKETMAVPSKEGMSMTLEVSVIYHLDPSKSTSVYKEIGSDYQNVILVPSFRSVTRGVTAQYDAKALYTSEREELANELLSQLRGAVASRGIIVESTPLRSIQLPPSVQASINDKMSADQANQAYDFKIKMATKEADRKRAEAQGIHDFQQIVTQGISEPLLVWKGIEATELLARSPNTKIIVIGNSKNGLPLILNSATQ